MPNAISNLLARRGKKTVLETGLDSVWGDMQITFPTDSAPTQPTEDPKVEAYMAQISEILWSEQTPAPNSRHTPDSGSTLEATSIWKSTQLRQAESAPNTGTRGVPLQAKHTIAVGQPRSRSRSRSGQHLQPSSRTCHVRTRSDTTDVAPQLSHSLWLKEDYFGHNKPKHSYTISDGVLSPPLSDGGATRNQCHEATTASAVHIRERSRETSQHCTTSTNAASNFVNEAQRSLGTADEDWQFSQGTPSSIHTDVTLESLHSPIVTILSPRSDDFAVSDLQKLRDEVMALRNEIKQLQQQAPTPLLLSAEMPETTFRATHVTSHSSQSTKPHLSYPSATHNEDSNLPQLMALSSHPLKSLTGAEFFADGPGPSYNSADETSDFPAPLSAVTEVTDIDDVESWSLPIHSHSIFAGQSSLRISTLGSSVDDTSDALLCTKSPALGVTSMMRVSAPSLAVTHSIRDRSPRREQTLEEKSPNVFQYSRRHNPQEFVPRKPQVIYRDLRNRSTSSDKHAHRSASDSHSATTAMSTRATDFFEPEDARTQYFRSQMNVPAQYPAWQ